MPVTSTKNQAGSLPPFGYCHCCCGGKTPLAKTANRKEGRIKGQPLRFLPGHQNRKRVRVTVEDRDDYVTPCFISTLVPGKDGYVRQTVGGRKGLAHRVAYEQVHGEIEEGLEIDHLCGQRNCLRIDHLEAVDRRENLRRCGKCKLTRADVIDIRRSEEPQSVLAERYGVTQGHISRTQAGLVWRDVV